MIIKRLGPLSFAKVTGALYGIFGLIAGTIFALIALVGGTVSGKSGGPLFGALFGVGAIVFIPILYGGLGFLVSLLMAAVYNGVAGLVGGVEIEVEPEIAEANSPPGV
jgi:hypothetical protein